MAFVVETGAGLSTANAYMTVQAFKDYHADRGNALPVGHTDPDDIQFAIVNATDYLDRRYRSVIRGLRLNTNQSLEFPRINAFYDDGRIIDGVPRELEQATAELGLLSMELAVAGTSSGSRTLSPNPAYEDSNRIVKEKDEQVGPLRKKVVYLDEGTVLTWRKYPAVQGLVRELIFEGQEMLRA